MSEAFYRKYIKKAVLEATQAQSRVDNNIVYSELTKWLKDNNIRLDSEMFKAVLAVSRAAAAEYLKGEKPVLSDIAKEKGIMFHTFTANDEIHTSEKEILKYVEPFYEVLTVKLDEAKQLGNSTLRERKVDVVKLGRLFDQILSIVKDEDAERITQLMDKFMLEDLSAL